MTAAPVLEAAARGVENGERRLKSNELLAWQVDSPPRLELGDLSDPVRFHRRLEDWIMKQK